MYCYIIINNNSKLGYHSSTAKMSKITNIATRAIYDARGQPTPEVEIQTACGTFRASAPSQSSFSRHDCVELKDNEPRSWGGRGSQKCIDAIRTRIRPVLTGFDI